MTHLVINYCYRKIVCWASIVFTDMFCEQKDYISWKVTKLTKKKLNDLSCSNSLERLSEVKSPR